jgi:hypothetical protein
VAGAQRSAVEVGESGDSGDSGDGVEAHGVAEVEGAAEEPLAITLVTEAPQNGPNPAPAPQTQLSLDGEPAALLDSPSAERVQTVVRGLRDLRDQAHEILQILRRNP